MQPVMRFSIPALDLVKCLICATLPPASFGLRHRWLAACKNLPVDFNSKTVGLNSKALGLNGEAVGLDGKTVGLDDQAVSLYGETVGFHGTAMLNQFRGKEVWNI
jgi:hypothetical protein